MELNIKEIAKNCTKEEFLENIVCNKDGDIVEFFGKTDICYCPVEFGLEDNCHALAHCKNDCWKKAIKNLDFKQKEDEK